MSPHKVYLLPSPLALTSYGISENGFLPAEPPLQQLPNVYYQPWERIISRLPELLRAGLVRDRIDALPVLDTAHLHNEADFQRAYSILAVMAQAYIWQGPEPSQVSRTRSEYSVAVSILMIASVSLQQFACPFWKRQSV